ncbi:hypothetical protein ACQ4PT_068544 [Festuca glaucescens]
MEEAARGRRIGLVPPLAMATQEPHSKSRGGGSSTTDGSVVSNSSPVLSRANGKERWRKGKMLAVDETLLCAKNGGPLCPPVEKLMGDAIRSLGTTQSHADTFASIRDTLFDDIGIVSDKLRNILRDLDAVNHVCLYKKNMSFADRDNEQNRLLVSCKVKKNRNRPGYENPKVILDRIISEKELALVQQPEQEDKDKERQENKKGEKKRKKRKRKEMEKENAEEAKPDGLDVQAYDRNGEMYHLTFKFLTSNIAYRIIGNGWKEFRTKNNLVVEKTGEKKRRKKGKKPSPKDQGQSSSPSLKPNNGGRTKQEIDNIRIEVWVFRSRKLKLGCPDHPKGALGMILLHYLEEDRAEHVDNGRAGTQQPCGSEDDMEREGPADHHGEAMADIGEGAHEMVMAEQPGDVPEVALPVVVADAVAPQGEAAALRDTDGSTTPQRELEAAEGLLLLRSHWENMLNVDIGGGCGSICCYREQATALNASVAPPFR